MPVQQICHGLTHLRHQTAADLGVAEFVLRLRFEDRLSQPDRDGADDAVAHILAVELLLRVLVDCLEEPLAESAEVCATGRRVLPIHERVVGLGVAHRVGEGEFERLVAKVQRWVDRVAIDVFPDEIEQAGLGEEARAVVVDREARVEVGVQPDSPLDVLFIEARLAEDLGVGRKADDRPVGLVFRLAARLALEQPSFEPRFGELARAYAAHEKLAGQSVDRLRAYTIETHAELEHVVVVLGPGVDLRDAFDDLAQRDPAAEVADGHLLPVDADQDLLPEAHDVFVDRIVDDFLQQDVNAVVVVLATADPADVHPRPLADMLE